MISRAVGLAVVFTLSLLYGCIADTMSQKVIAPELQVGLRSVPDVIQPGERVEILFYLENTSDAPIRILPWNTPLEGELTADIFDISIDGEPVLYQGIMIKRAAPTDADYTTFEPGERREVVVDLAESYPMSAPGSYRISLRTYGDDTIMQIDGVDAAIVTEDVVIVRE